MTLEAKAIKFSNLEISNNGSDLLFNATQNIVISPTTQINAIGENINMENNTITNCNSINGISGINLILEGKGNGNVILSAPALVTTNMDVKEDGVAYFTTIPTTTQLTSALNNNILKYQNFETIVTTFLPTISGSSGTGTPVYTAQVSNYTKVSNFVMFRCSISVSSFGGIPTTDSVRLQIPFAINYTTINMPQIIGISSYTGQATTATDLVLTIGGNGDSVIGSSVDYCNIYYRPTSTSSGMSIMTFGDLVVPFVFAYSGCYYVL